MEEPEQEDQTPELEPILTPTAVTMISALGTVIVLLVLSAGTALIISILLI